MLVTFLYSSAAFPLKISISLVFHYWACHILYFGHYISGLQASAAATSYFLDACHAIFDSHIFEAFHKLPSHFVNLFLFPHSRLKIARDIYHRCHSDTFASVTSRLILKYSKFPVAYASPCIHEFRHSRAKGTWLSFPSANWRYISQWFFQEPMRWCYSSSPLSSALAAGL